MFLIHLWVIIHKSAVLSYIASNYACYHGLHKRKDAYRTQRMVLVPDFTHNLHVLTCGTALNGWAWRISLRTCSAILCTQYGERRNPLCSTRALQRSSLCSKRHSVSRHTHKRICTHAVKESMAICVYRQGQQFNVQGCIQKFQDSTCKKKFAYLGC